MRWLQVLEELVLVSCVQPHLTFAMIVLCDVVVLNSHPCSDALFERQAQVYGDVLEACLNNTGCTGFETWGFVRTNTDQAFCASYLLGQHIAAGIADRFAYMDGYGEETASV